MAGRPARREVTGRAAIRVSPGASLGPETVDAQLVASRLTAGGLDEIECANDQLGDSTSCNLSAEIAPPDQLRISPLCMRRTLGVKDDASGRRGRLFTAQVARLQPGDLTAEVDKSCIRW